VTTEGQFSYFKTSSRPISRKKYITRRPNPRR